VTRLPLTVIGGYLGAGKTTLINRILTEDHGKRLMVMVNDFGAVNIDAALIAAQGADTIELTNGCVCCTMGADLFMAVGKVLDAPTRPDHLLIEASGIADPARIAEVARNEPDLSYAGILTVVDGLNFGALLEDAQIAPQLESQVQVADLILVSKVDVPPPEMLGRLEALGAKRVLPQDADLGALLWDREADLPERSTAHAHFTRWVQPVTDAMTRADLMAKLKARPAGLYRVKGFVPLVEGVTEVQVVGKSIDFRATDYSGETVLIGIGPEGQLELSEVTVWWDV